MWAWSSGFCIRVMAATWANKKVIIHTPVLDTGLDDGLEVLQRTGCAEKMGAAGDAEEEL